MPILGEVRKARVPIKIWAPLDEVESQSLDQLVNIANLPFVFHHVAAMPDVHLGKGATVGSVIATKGAICPAAVGVDIGCGMAAVRTNLTSFDFGDGVAAKLRNAIERGVPVGNGPAGSHNDSTSGAASWLRRAPADMVAKISARQIAQLGTLGGGNHFIELCHDERDQVWIMLHSGSRNFGKTVAEGHMKRAKEIAKQAQIHLADPDLAYLDEATPEFDAYVADVEFAQEYASKNRLLILEEVVRNLRHHFPQLRLDEPVNCHHNYLARETHFGEKVIVTRKGAIRAGAGVLGIIPGSMGTRSYIVEGLGNPESFHSCSHGAGRRMSRSEAKRKFTMKDLESQTSGVECRKDAGVIDEIPAAYKDIDSVMLAQQSLVEPLFRLKQLLCVKG
ncbi:MAG TPA: RtcB family protein [Thermoanaerobaculia bacterium]|nr:RtcB family protein [Thermoanaerobaculia bacterium]